ncbi:MAG: hypothetical protein LBQ57_08330 [Spirochaetales bacterium]|nr:hypothetical protein [Spirochaetales bacterium]
MSAKYMHVGIPVTNKKPNMIYNEGAKFWMSKNVDDYDYKIEYLKFEEGTIFPEILHKNPHVAYQVDDMEKYLQEADRVIVEPMEVGPKIRIAFIVKDETIFELYEDKTG